MRMTPILHRLQYDAGKILRALAPLTGGLSARSIVMGTGGLGFMAASAYTVGLGWGLFATGAALLLLDHSWDNAANRRRR